MSLTWLSAIPVCISSMIVYVREFCGFSNISVCCTSSEDVKPVTAPCLVTEPLPSHLCTCLMDMMLTGTKSRYQTVIIMDNMDPYSINVFETVCSINK